MRRFIWNFVNQNLLSTVITLLIIIPIAPLIYPQSRQHLIISAFPDDLKDHPLHFNIQHNSSKESLTLTATKWAVDLDRSNWKRVKVKIPEDWDSAISEMPNGDTIILAIPQSDTYDDKLDSDIKKQPVEQF